MLIVKTVSAAIFEVSFGKMSKTKRCVEDSGLTTPSKLRRSNVIAQSTLRGGHVYCAREKAIRSFTSTSLAHMVVETIARGT